MNNIFNKSKYTKWYYTIINNAMSSNNTVTTIYTENHHIIPRSMGGSNNYNNLVTLTAREHFICHILLTKMCNDTNHKRKMNYAAFMMCHIEGPGQKRYTKLNSRVYETLKSNHANYTSIKMTNYWNNLTDKEYADTCTRRKEIANRPEVIAAKTHFNEDNGMYGKTHTDKVKQKLGILATERFKNKSYEELYGRQKSDQLRQKRSNDMQRIRATQDLTGTNNPNAKRVHIRGIDFGTSKEAAEYFCRSKTTISEWLRKHDDCYFI